MHKWMALALAMGMTAGCQERDRTSGPADDEAAGVEATDDRAIGGTAAGGATDQGGTAAGAQKFTEVGTVSDSSGDSITLRRPTGEALELNVGPQTDIMQDGQRVGADAISAGAEVRASYVMRGQEKIAERIEVMGAAPEGRGPGGEGGDMVPEGEEPAIPGQ